jgi:heme iron utilization protein
VPDPSVSATTADRPGDRRNDHAVPGPAVAETKRTLDATPGLIGEPTDAERARTIVTAGHTAALSTVAVDSGGVPFGSLVAHAVDGLGRPLLCLSDLAEHSRNLTADPRASVLVTESGDGDPLALGRVTLLGEVSVLAGDERSTALATYQAAHPDAFYVEFSDFRIYRLEVTSARFVGGFGRMSWVDAAGYASAEPDPLRPHRAGIVEHMNNDHADSLVAFCRMLAGRPDTTTARMLDVDRYGFSVLAGDGPEGDPGNLKALRFGFDAVTDTPLEVRTAMVELVRRVRSQA